MKKLPVKMARGVFSFWGGKSFRLVGPVPKPQGHAKIPI